jgi:hypothetical protein
MKVVMLLFVAFLNACDCVPAKWWHSGERVSGLYVRDHRWRGGGYMTWKRCDENGVWYWDCIPVSMASEVQLLNASNEVSE